jgi:hypothetical protein
MKIMVKPNVDVPVPMPDGKSSLPAKGITTDDSPWWRRREMEGDVTITDASEAKAKKE